MSGADDIFAKLREMREVVKEVHTQFCDPALTTFVCVGIAEFLSLYETERLIQELTEQNIECRNVVVNQLLYLDTKVSTIFRVALMKVN